MNKKQIMDVLERISKGLATSTIAKIEENDKVFAVQDLEDVIHDLQILIYEIKRY